MIGALTGLFIDRGATTLKPPLFRVAPEPRRILVVDAGGRGELIGVAAALERSGESPVTVAYAQVGMAADPRLDALTPDVIWLFADGASDAAYCGLVARELAARFGVAPFVAVFGHCPGLRSDLTFDEPRRRGLLRRGGGEAVHAAAGILDFDGAR